MEFSTAQKEAIDDVVRWFTVGTEDPVYRLFGYAGTGKTTIAQAIAKKIGLEVLFAAYTGKAASVLEKKGCKPVSTVHAAIYTPLEKSLERLQHLRMELSGDIPTTATKAELERQIAHEEEKVRTPGFIINPEGPLARADLLILDECSMIDAKLAGDILSFGVPVLSLGDPAQLPPVGGEGYFINGKPNMMLTEIHRQAAGNPIIQLASAIRQGAKIRHERNLGTVTIKRRPIVQGRKGFNKSLIMEADQVICGKNATRHRLNMIIRSLRGFSGQDLQEGERIICLQNDAEVGVLNGQIFTLVSQPRKIRGTAHFEAEMRLEGTDDVRTIKFWGERIHDKEGKTIPEAFRLARMKKLMIADLGYAITCHKAQGSDWSNVCVIDESSVFRENAAKWLYTATTRAADRLSVLI